MPPEMGFEPAKEWRGEHGKIPNLFIAVMDVIRNAPGEDVIDKHVLNFTIDGLQQLPDLPPCVSVRHRAAALRLRMLRDNFI